MSDHPFGAKFREAVEAWTSEGKAGIDKLAELLHDDVVWHMVGDEEPIRGKAKLLETLGQDVEGLSISGEVHDVLANDRHAIAMVRANLSRGDKQASYDAVEIVHHEDGKVTERWAMVDDFAAMVDFWSE